MYSTLSKPSLKSSLLNIKRETESAWNNSLVSWAESAKKKKFISSEYFGIMIYRKSIKQCNNWFFLKRNKNKGLIAMGSRTLVDITLHTLYFISFHVPLFTLKYFLSCPSGEQSRVKNQMWKKKKIQRHKWGETGG